MLAVTPGRRRCQRRVRGYDFTLHAVLQPKSASQLDYKTRRLARQLVHVTDTAKGIPQQSGSASIKNLGEINYRLFRTTSDIAFIEAAIIELRKRLARCRRLKQELTTMELSGDPAHKIQMIKDIATKEAIALARLSLSYSAQDLRRRP